MKDNDTYGFAKADAEALLPLIELRDKVIQGQVPSRGRGNSGGIKLVVTPGGGIAARSGTSVSSASCNIVGITSGSLGATSGSITVFNPWPVAIPASYYIVAKQESETGTWVADFPGVINVRWDSPDLEQTLDGTNYLNIDTAEVC